MKKVFTVLSIMLFIGCTIDRFEPAQLAETQGPLSGINCWDSNGNRINDLSEDLNNDGVFDALDCQGDIGGQGTSVGFEIDGVCVTYFNYHESNGTQGWQEGEERHEGGEVCATNGSDGTNGTNGTNGKNAAVRVIIYEEGSDECLHGGQLLEWGLDDNEDGELQDDEVDGSQLICNLKCVHEVTSCVEVYDTNPCDGSKPYSVWLYDGSKAIRLKTIDLKFTEYTNGNAVLEGKAQNVDDPSSICELYIVYQGKTYDTPSGSPKDNNCNVIDATDWTYYTEMYGTITELGEHWSMDLTRRGPAMQVGADANQNEFEPNNNSASGWFNTTHPTYTIGDININLCNDEE